MKTVGFRALLVAFVLAQATTASAEVVQPMVLVLPTQTGGAIPDVAEWRKEFDGRLLEAVRKSRRVPRLASVRSPSCTDAECASTLVALEKVDLLLSGKVLLDGAKPPNYRISVVVYDRARNELRRADDACPACSEFQAAEQLSMLGSHTLDGARQVAEPPVALRPTPPLFAPVAPAQSARTQRDLTPLYATLTAVGAAGLVGGVVGLGEKASQYGENECGAGVPPGVPCGLHRDTTNGIVATAIVAGVSLGVGLAGAVLLRRSLHAKGAGR